MGRNKYKLLDVTAKLIGERGFGRVSVDDILKESKVQKSNFYYHFKTKDDLALAALDSIIERIDNDIWQGILQDKSLSPHERLEKLVVTLVSRFEAASGKVGDPIGHLLMEADETNPKIQEKLNDFFMRYAAHIENVIQEGMEEDEFRQSLIPREVAEALICQIQGAYLLARAHQEPTVFRRNIEFLINLICS